MSLNQTAHIDSWTWNTKNTGNIWYKRFNVEAKLNVLLQIFTGLLFFDRYPWIYLKRHLKFPWYRIFSFLIIFIWIFSTCFRFIIYDSWNRISFKNIIKMYTLIFCTSESHNRKAGWWWNQCRWNGSLMYDLK